MKSGIEILSKGHQTIPLSQELFDMCLEHFNEPFILIPEIVRCIGYAEDDDDCYIIYKDCRGKIGYMTCVGGYTWLNSLKGQNHVISSYNGEEWDDLYRIDNSLELNRCKKEQKFILDLTYGRPITGFFANLTPEQQKAVLKYKGPENFGEDKFKRKDHVKEEAKENQPDGNSLVQSPVQEAGSG